MIAYRESKISAHHNYLVNGMLTPGFAVGAPSAGEDFYFLADVVLAGESTSRISARLFDGTGSPLVELRWNRMAVNKGGCRHQSIAGGFRVSFENGELLLEAQTQRFANGYLTRLRGKLYNQDGTLVMETLGDSIRVDEKSGLVLLEEPFVPPDLQG